MENFYNKISTLLFNEFGPNAVLGIKEHPTCFVIACHKLAKAKQSTPIKEANAMNDFLVKQGVDTKQSQGFVIVSKI